MFYTGKGDKGESHIGKKKYPKDSPILEALGTLDELNSLLGWLRSDKEGEFNDRLKSVQESLFLVQANIGHLLAPEFSVPTFPEEKIRQIEEEIEGMEKEIDPERGFVVSGEQEIASQLDYARAVSRRAEREVFRLTHEYDIHQDILTYLNRLSSYLYALARYSAFTDRIKESHPRYE